MRLVASVQNPAPSSRVSERDPLPPEDRTPVRSDPPRTSLEALYRAQAPRLLRFFSRRTDCQDARDLVQESFTRFAGADASTESAPEQPEAYLNQIAVNLLRNRASAAFQQRSEENTYELQSLMRISY